MAMSHRQFDKCIIIHGCPPNKESVIPKNKRWMNWIAEKLKEKGLQAFAPDMPTPWKPRYEEWKKEFEKIPVTDRTLLVGHSCGAAFLVRWLLETHIRVGKLILIAPAKIPETENDTRKPMYDFDIPSDASKIAREIVMFTSNDLPHHLQSFKIYQKYLHPRLIQLPDKGHFLIYTMKTNEFPELLYEIV